MDQDIDDSDLKTMSDDIIITECIIDYVYEMGTRIEDERYASEAITCSKNIDQISKFKYSQFYDYYQKAFHWAMTNKRYQNFPCIQKAYDLFKCGRNKN